MATLKEHQAAMVELLANGSGIPASASRLAHAMHDLIQNVLMGQEPYDKTYEFDTVTGRIIKRKDATTPGLNDKALSKREKELKTDSPAKWPTPAEQRVKELENTIKQLRGTNIKLRSIIAEQKAELKSRGSCAVIGETDTQVCDHSYSTDRGWVSCDKCGKLK